ncbi:MAG: 3D domain-containing protein [Proteobacteria bacterium]|nr:3D domain-containing protein [Pseudomonadota bacterium]
MRTAALVAIALSAAAAAAHADTSKLAKDDVPIQPRQPMRGKNKLCCGYPLAEDLGFALRFYWLALEDDYDDPQSVKTPKTGGVAKVSMNSWVEIYTPLGLFMQRIPERFAWALRLEGSGLMRDGRVINYTGPCRFGYGTCFEQLDVAEHPFGRGAGLRPLIPFKSVAVDPRIVKIGEPIYIPEFDGMVLPDGSTHDGCVRADDTGGGIKKRKMDFFVVTYGNFRFLLDQLLGVTWITPHIEAPRCEYLRDL